MVSREEKEKLAQEIIDVPITGKVITIEIKVGDTVKEGDVICYIEAMKMENPILAPVAGKITEIKVAAGQKVETGNVIAIIEY
ncbi:MAG: acetyl-CoA carboxylase biotin carboxyl carrier protein subunit [Chloroflexi bacterium]|nr:acetyl-CoA carboxylase biotin carboxyl carrier protein subunit [Chloroflexota bacterium]